MRKFGEVISLFDADGVPSAGTADGSGVLSGTPAQGASDANSSAGSTDIQAQLEKLEKDRRAQQAVYDRKLAEAEKRNRDLMARLEQIQTGGMDEAQKVAFERDQLKARLEEVEAEKRINDYAEAFAAQYGIDKSKLDLTSEEAVAQSGWQAVADLVQELRQQKSTTPVTETTKTPPQNTTKVITGSGGVPKTRLTQSELMTRIAQSRGKTAITEEEFYRWAENNPEAMNQWISSQTSE
jgi:hypothetical protein